MWRHLLRRLGLREREDAPIRKILFIKLVEQGATVLAYDALCCAIEKVGRENVYFCVFEENREILDILDLLPAENILPIRTTSLFACVSDVLRSLYRVRRERIDSVVDMEFFARASAILAYLCGAPRRVGIDRLTSEAPYRGDLMTHRMQYSPYLHTAVAYHLLIDALDSDPGQIPQAKAPTDSIQPRVPHFEPEAEERERVAALLSEGLPAEAHGPLVILNPNVDDSLGVRKWPAERYVALGKRLVAAHPDIRICGVGTPDERESVEALCREIGSPNTVSMAGRTTLRDLIVLTAMADVLVTNDCGPAHFACMTDCDVVVMFGPETPQLFSPLGERIHAIDKRLGCSPCLTVFNHRLSACNDNVCIQSITVDEILEAVEDCLVKRGGA